MDDDCINLAELYYKGFELLKDRFGPIIQELHAPLASGKAKGFDEKQMQRFENNHYGFDFQAALSKY